MPKPKTPLVTVDCAVFNSKGQPLLIRRKYAPFKGGYALPGGFVDLGESVEDAARRELLEETGLKAGKLHLIGVYSKPGRDPRGDTVTIAYLTKIGRQTPVAGDDAVAAEWVGDWRKQKIAFDHEQIIKAAIKLKRQLA